MPSDDAKVLSEINHCYKLTLQSSERVSSEKLCKTKLNKERFHSDCIARTVFCTTFSDHFVTSIYT